jgi:hypothetical protein
MRSIWSTAIVVIAVSAAANAQSANNMQKPMKEDTTHVTYTGCLESLNHGASFALTHIGDHQMPMKDDKAMKDGASMKDDMPMKDDMSGDHMSGDHMTPGAVSLMGRSDLTRHVGQEVRVTGSLSKETAASTGSMRNALPALNVSSLKVVAKACS